MLSGKPSLLVFADDWGRHPSSCQHLVRRLQDDFRILWVNSIGTRRVRADAFTMRRGWEKIRSWRRGLRQVAESMWVVDAPMLPTVGSTWAQFVNRQLVTNSVRAAMKRVQLKRPVVMTTLPFVSTLLGNVGQSHLIYYCTDDYSEWPSADREALLAAEQEIRARADLILAVSHKLVDRYRESAKCVYFPHAVDYRHFATTASIAEIPETLRAVPSPRIGFFGLVYEKLDFALLEAVAQAFPHVQLVMIGPVVHCPESFAALSNVHLVGAQPYDELPAWLSGLDVLLLPYVDDEMIRQSNPLKLRECLASGKPTVSVNVPEAGRFAEYLSIASSTEDFIAAVRGTLAGNGSPSGAAERQRCVADETWDTRADELRVLLKQLKSETAACVGA